MSSRRNVIKPRVGVASIICACCNTWRKTRQLSKGAYRRRPGRMRIYNTVACYRSGATSRVVTAQVLKVQKRNRRTENRNTVQAPAGTREKPSPHRGWWWGNPCTSSQLASSTQLSVHHVASNNCPPSSHYPPFELVIKFILLFLMPGGSGAGP